MESTSPIGSRRRLQPAAGGRPGSSDQDVHLLDRLHALHKYRYLAVNIFLLVMVASLLRTYTTTPMYRAQARVLIEIEDQQSAAALATITTAGNLYYQDPVPYYQTQYRVLQSRQLARRTVARLQLGQVPEFNGTGPTPTGLNDVFASMRLRAGAAARMLFGRPGIERGAPTPGAPAEPQLVAAFLSRVSVEPVKDSRLLDVSFVSADSRFARTAVNALAEEYVQQNFELRQETLAKSLAWLSQELVRQQAKVEASERALAQYREDQNALSLEGPQNIVVAKLNQLNDAVTKAKTVRVQKEALYNQIRSLSPMALADTVPAILQNPYIQATKARLAELQRERTTLLERYGEKYPDVIRVNASLEDAQRQLDREIATAVEALRNDYESAAAEERTLAGALEEQKAAAVDLSRKSVSYTVLEREAHSNRTVYESLLQREKELQVLASSQGNNVRLLDRAEVPGAPFTPKPRSATLLAVLFGVALALIVVSGIDYLDDTVKTPEDVTRKLKLPFLGLVPKMRTTGDHLLSIDAPQEFGEAYRSLRTSLVFSNSAAAGRVVIVTSAQPLEGKTTTACNLALALALGGARVLLIDADMRRSGIHRTLALTNEIGLSHVLSGQVTPKQAFQKHREKNLVVMTAGPVPSNPSELLASERMRTLLRSMHASPFDWVIVDTPPVLAVTDAVVLCPQASGVAFVIASEMTRRRLAERAIDTLMAGNPNLLGVVLNRVDLERNRYYYSRHYGYESQSYYATPSRA